MSNKQQGLGLTWPTKDHWEAPEPRILVEKESFIERKGLSDNMLIYGDNLLGLKALERDYTGKVKCIYIDPPFNTKSCFEYYDDSLEHSHWLDMMKERLIIMHKLLKNEGFLFVHLDDGEMPYAKVLLDEIFGRKNYINTISMTTNAPSGFKATASSIFSTANYLLIYSKSKRLCSLKKTYIQKKYDSAYSKVLLNPDDHYSKWQWNSIAEVVANSLGFTTARDAKKHLENSFNFQISDFAEKNAVNIFRTASIGGGAAIKRAETIAKSKKERNRVFVHPYEDLEDFYILNGEQILFYKDRFVKVDDKLVPGEIITDIWTDISWTGIAKEGGVEFKNGKKPEALIKRIIEMSTNPGDIVLDCFAGSGTTGAVAHKMKRRWIMIELGKHCHTHIIPRMMEVINGEDISGITEITNWKGGGGFRYYELAPSLMEKNRLGRFTISKHYNLPMLAEAVCLHTDFKFSPRKAPYWIHGHSTENDYIYVVPREVSGAELERLSEEVGSKKSLLVMCTAFPSQLDTFLNLTVQKIPKAILNRCEWGRDDYSLKNALETEVKVANRQSKPKTKS